MHVLIAALHRPTKPTGVCRHAVNLALCLADAQEISRVTLLIGAWQRDYFEQSFELNSPKIELLDVDIKNSSLARNRWFVFGFPKVVQKLQPDIVHLSFPFPFIRQWFAAPVVATVHDLYPYECPENFGYPQVWFNQIFLRQCIRNSDGLTCVSKVTLDALEHYFPQVKRRHQAAVVYNVVDFADIEAAVPRQLLAQISDNNLNSFVITVAQHRKNKNLDMLIRAYGDLLHSDRIRPDTRLLLVGSAGPETEPLTNLVQSLNLEEQVWFLSGLEDGELRWLYEQAALFVIPSSTEGFCLPLAEALSLSCPVVCSDIPILREVGSAQCHYFELDAQAGRHLAKAIAAELAHPITRSKPTDFRFSRQEVSRQLIGFYEKYVS